MRLKHTRAATAGVIVAAAFAPSVASAQWAHLARFAHGGSASSEINAYDPVSKRAFIVLGGSNQVDVLSLETMTPTLVGSFAVPNGGRVNSVAIKNGLVAIAAEAESRTDSGAIHFYNADLTFGGAVNPAKSMTVGSVPDNVTFSPDGLKLLSANEGEANSYGMANSFNPEGSVSIIDLSGGLAGATVRTAGFSQYNTQAASLRAAGVRLIGPGFKAGETPGTTTVAQDFEPEYVAVSGDGTKAFVTLQEANAVAVLDIATATFTAIQPMGYKDHSLSGNRLDPSDQDGGIQLRNIPVKGMYMPDAIAALNTGGQTYYVTANEGDSRVPGDFPGAPNEETRLSSSGYVLDPTVFAGSNVKTVAGRLNVSNRSGDLDGDGDFDEIHAFGGRSFSIRDATGAIVYDSGEFIENYIATNFPGRHNTSHGSVTPNADNRSDDKGAEPEAVVIGEVDGRQFAFIGLERAGGVMIFDVTDPLGVTFSQYLNPLTFDVPLDDRGPEGLTFVHASDSPYGVAMLLVSNEISGSTSIYVIPEPASLALLLPAAALLRRRRR